LLEGKGTLAALQAGDTLAFLYRPTFIGSVSCQIGQLSGQPSFLGRLEHVPFFSANIENAAI